MQKRREQPLTPSIDRAVKEWSTGIDERRFRRHMVERSSNHPVIDIDIPTYLQHRRATVATSQRLDIGLRRNHRHLHALPREPFEPHHLLRFLREGRNVVLMQNQRSIAHVGYPFERPQTLTRCNGIVKADMLLRKNI